MFGIVAGVRLLLIAAWAGDTPYLDDWNATGWLHIHAAAAPHGIPWAWLVYPHAEHLVITQRLVSLGIAALNGQQWDVRAELMVAALAWGALAAGLVAFARRELSTRALVAWAAVVVAAETIPHAWENLLWAFQISFLLLIAFSLLALRWLTASAPLSGRWFGGLACAVAACASQASGLVVLLAAAVTALFQLLTQRPKRRVRAWVGFALLLAAAGTAKALLPAAAWIENLHAQNVSAWFQSLGSLLAWPWSRHAWLAPLVWLPATLFVARRLRWRALWQPADAFWFGLVVWSLAMIAASAWARATMLVLGPPPSRYGDVLIVGLLANAFLALRWAQSESLRPRRRAALTTAWLVFALGGVALYAAQLDRTGTPATTINAFSRRDFTASRPLHSDAVRAYVRTHDVAALDVQPPIYPVPEHTAELLDRLRAGHRWPATLAADPADDLPWLSRAARGSHLWAWALLGAGLVGAWGARVRTR